MPERAKLLADIERFLRTYDMAPTTFGRDAMGDSAFVIRLRGDVKRDMKLSTIDRAREWMTEYRKEHKPARPTSGAARAKAA